MVTQLNVKEFQNCHKATRFFRNSSTHGKGAKAAKKKLYRRSIFYDKITKFSEIFSIYFLKNTTFALFASLR